MRDENLKDGMRVTIIATGFEQARAEEAATIIDLKNFVTPNFKTDKAAAGTSMPVEEAEGDLTLKLTDGQYDIPAYLRRRLASKSFHN